jgi:AcrR family transcriptional regulator
VTSTRAYHSPAREEQARRTRRAIVGAAHELFVERGYAATTVDAVAASAGVSRKTVFTAVGGKGTLLKLAIDWALVGDDEPVPMSDRPGVQRIESTTDPAEAVRLWAALIAETIGRVSDLYPVLTAAADVDPEAKELLDRSLQERHVGAGFFVAHLQRIGGLRADLDPEVAADVCWLYMDAGLHERLVRDRGWPHERYERFLEDAVTAALT